MNVSRLRIAFVAIGLLASGPAFAQYNLTITARMQAGAPAGTIGQVIIDPSSLPTTTTPSIACATDGTGTCVGLAAAGATIVLAPADVSNSTFASWSGCTSTSGNLCNVTMTAAKAVTANFRPTTFPLTAKTYSTTATQVSYLTAATTPAIDCETRTGTTHTACTGAVAAFATSVVVTAVPAAGTKVTAWAGCTPTSATTCAISSMSTSKLVTATFGAANIPVTAQVSGGGTITATLGGSVTDAMSCSATSGADCSAQVVGGGSITLTAAAGSGYTFIGWSSTPTGLCSGTALTCTLTNVTAAAAVGATFRTSACASCHGVPPSSHGTATQSCATCHTNYTTSSVNTATHMDGKVEVAGAPVAAPAGDGFNAQILGAMLAADAQPVVRMRFTNDAGQGLDMSAAGYFSPTAPQYRAGWTTGGLARTPALGITRVDADGTFHPAMVTTLANSTTYSNAASTSENLSVANFAVAAGQPAGTYDVTLALNWMPSTSYATPTTLTPRIAFDANATYRVVFLGARFGAADRKMQTSANATLDLSPSGTLISHQIVTDDACGACHGKFKINFHSDQRIGAQTCKLCHYDGRGLAASATFDPNQATTDMGYQNFVHRLHSGLDTKHHFTGRDIKMAPSHSLYFEGSSNPSGVPAIAVVDPELTTECSICHKGVDASVWYTKPSRKACGSCHDINWTTGRKFSDGSAAHPVFPMTDDNGCSTCHPASGSINSAAGIWPVQKVHGKFFEPNHKLDFTSSLPSLANGPRDFRLTLMDVSAVGTTVPTFKVSATLDGAPYDMWDGAGASTMVAGGRLGTCAFQVAGPTTDYVIPADGSNSTLSCATRNGWVSTGIPGEYTFKSAASTRQFFLGKPAGYYTAAFEIMYTDQVVASNGDIVRHPASANPNFLTVKWDGTSASVVTGAEQALNARRNVVEFAKCNNCHYDLGFHSNRGRKGPDYCATCHNPKLDNGTRARFKVSEAWIDAAVSPNPVYLPESVSLNVFIHRIHMGEKLPSVAGVELTLPEPNLVTTIAAIGSPWVPVPGEIKYGATRAASVGLTAATGPGISDFTEFNMPNPMGRCDQCHVSSGAKQTWALNENPGLAPIERTYRACVSTTPSWATEPWCNVTSNSGPAKLTTVVTPPLKAVCTSCHDSAATSAHTDLYTVNPMTAGATELCASCHGAGKAFDSILVHQPIP